MDNNFLNEEDLKGLLSEINVPKESTQEMSKEMEASQRRIEEYLIKNMEE